MGRKHDQRIVDIATKPLAEEFHEESKNVQDTNIETRKSVDNLTDTVLEIIDFIQATPEQREHLLKLLKSKHKKELKPKSFSIKIVFENEEDSETVNNLRKTLNKQKNSAFFLNYEEFKKHNKDKSDYTVFFGNPDEITSENETVIYSAYGCKILKLDDFTIVATYTKIPDMDSYREEFIEYYTNLTNKALNKKSEKALNKRFKQKILNMNVSNKYLETWENIADSIVGNSLPELPGILVAIAGLPFILMMGLLAIPIGLSEAVVDTVVQSLRDSNFDKKFVSDAQRHILQIKICEFFTNEQIKHFN